MPVRDGSIQTGEPVASISPGQPMLSAHMFGDFLVRQVDKCRCGAQALSDARRCIERDPLWPQGHFDKGCAEAALFQFSSARDSFLKVSVKGANVH